MNILLAPNSYKECADSVEIAELISNLLRRESSLNIIKKPITDGGDGFLEVCKKLFNTSPLSVMITKDNEQYLNKLSDPIFDIRQMCFH